MMFKKLVILILIVSAPAKLLGISTKIETSSRAIASLIDIMKENYYIEFELVVLGDDKNLMRIADKIMNYSTAPVTLKVDRIFNKKTKEYFISESKSAVFLVSQTSYKHTFEELAGDNLAYKQLYFLRYCPYDDVLEGQFYSPTVIQHYDRIFLLYHTDDGNMTLIGNQMLSKKSCKPVTKSVNTFLTSKKSWNHTKFMPTYENFYGCKLKVCANNAEEIDGVFVRIRCEEDGRTCDIGGFSTFLFSFLLEKFNIGRYVSIPENESEEKCDLFLFFHRLLQDENMSAVMKKYVETYPVYHVQYAFIVTKGLSYTPMEKLLLPFDLETWIMIMITFAIGFLTIFIIYRCNRFVQKFVFGTFVRDPSLHLTSSFFGIAVRRLPGRNFARFLFMVFTLYCLIIRTAYQGKMFEFMNKDVRKPTAESVDDLIHMDIPLIKLKSSLNYSLISRDDEKLKVKAVNLANIKKHFQSHISYENETFAVEEIKDGIFVGSKKVISSQNHQFASESASFNRIFFVFESSRSFPLSWLSKRSGFFIDSLNKFLMESEQYGFTSYFYNSKFDDVPPSPPSTPKILTMKMLSAGFIVWITSVFLACIVFVIELIVGKRRH